MNVSEAIDLLKESELKQLKTKDDKPAIRGMINMGILEIHKRFVLWQSEAILTMVDAVTEYKMDGTDANVTMNLTDHDFLHLDEAFDDDGESLSINDESDPMGIATPKWNLVEVPPIGITPGAEISLIYRASPKFLTHEKQQIPLPPQLMEALFHYVGYRGHAGVKGGGERNQNENSTHYKRFEMSCQRVKTEGLYTEDSLNSRKFENRGFV
jgi:hypothetical protein